MENLVLAAHVILAAGIIALVLLQQGKGAEAGAAFGSGASQTVFGSQGTGNFLSRMTAVLATGLFVTSFVLAIYAKEQAVSVGAAGIPTVEVVEDSQLPVLDEPKISAPVETDIPTAK
ncbi:preprotein translocase subunit SecG [Neptunomonas antarctica]|uniref:Protein-export membrane protein SecG n=1 Tax=Neptunomonas antarctica TaxID=619304 RepID=A0A1N7PLL1_9GAMM|nr:preprotein translocase subunit SecG [Neptunomonas antarctica]SIT11269.1 protein translocase subunit secG [Neptunomonas antarctica]